MVLPVVYRIPPNHSLVVNQDETPWTGCAWTDWYSKHLLAVLVPMFLVALCHGTWPCQLMLATSGDAAVDAGHFWPKFHHLSRSWSPRRTSKVCTLESSLATWAMVGKSRPRLAEETFWIEELYSDLKSTPGPLDEAGAKCGFPGELKKLIGLSRSASEHNFQVTLALCLWIRLQYSSKKQKVDSPIFKF